MSDTSLNQIIQYGTDADRIAFTPSPAPTSKVLYIWYATDTGATWVWDGSAWQQITGAGAITIDVSAGASSAALGSIVFSNSNGLTFGLSDSTITASHNGISRVNISAPGSSNNLSNFVFSNSNGVTFGLSGSTITASISQSTSPAALSVSAGASTDVLAAIVFSDSNNVSFGLSGSTVTATATVATSLSNINVSAGATSNNLSALTFANSNGVSFGINASTITASVASAIANIKVSAGASSANLTDITFSNSNGVSFGLSGSTVTASVAAGGAGVTWNNFANFYAIAQIEAFGWGNSLIVMPMDLPAALVPQGSHLRHFISAQTIANRTFGATSANTSWSAQQAMTFGYQLFTRGTGASSDEFQSVLSFTQGFTARTQFSNHVTQGSHWSASIDVTYPTVAGVTDLGTTYACTSQSYVINSGAGNIGTAFSGLKVMEVPVTFTLSAAQYWLGFGRSTQSTNNGGATGLSTTNIEYAMIAQSFISNAFQRFNETFARGNRLGLGIVTTNSIVLTSTSFVASQVRATNAGQADFVPFQIL